MTSKATGDEATLHRRHLERCVQAAREAARAGEGGPFAALVVKGDVVLAVARNQVISTLDPTAHAEVQAIRMACRALGSFQLDGCTLYSSCEPCPMCLGAIYWARPAAVYYAATRDDAAAGGFDDAFIYEQLARPQGEREIPFRQLHVDEAASPFALWLAHAGRVEY